MRRRAMKQRKESINKSTILHKNQRSRERINETLNRAQRLTDDPDKELREKECVCKSCHYLSNIRIGGASMTERPCGICEDIMRFGSTATDVICKECAKDNKICKQCGADMELKDRRTPYPFEQIREGIK